MRGPVFGRAHGALAVILVSLALVGCQDIFTYTPLAWLRRNPSSLTPAQRLEAAREALQSGDLSAMKAAYDAIKKDPGNDASYEAAQLGVELSGVGGLLNEVLNGQVSLDTPSVNTIGDYVDSTAGVDPTYLVDAAARFASLAGSSYPLTTNDRMMGSVGLALTAAASTVPAYDLTSPTVNVTAATDLLAAVKNDNTYAGQLYTYLVGLPGLP